MSNLTNILKSVSQDEHKAFPNGVINTHQGDMLKTRMKSNKALDD